jgi:hypothetical protein
MPSSSRLARRAGVICKLMLLIALCIGAGAVTSWAIAWYAVLRGAHVRSEPFSLSSHARYRIEHGTRRAGWGLMVAEFRPSYGMHFMARDEEWRNAGSDKHPKPETPDVWWDRYVTQPFPEQFGGRTLDEVIEEIPKAPAPANERDIDWRSVARVFIVRAGWPLPCVRYIGISAYRATIADPIVPSDVLGKRLELSVPLPVVPVWPGLAWNTLIFAAAWFFLGWSTLFAARRLRRLHRTRHNRCPACGYSLTGVTTNRCPECGHPAANPDLPHVSA